MKFNQHFDELGARVIHHMPDEDGVYIKETHIPAGVKLSMHVHTFTHKSVLASGKALLHVGGSSKEITAPSVFVVQTGVAHEVEAITDCVWLCIHATDESDPDKIDHTIVKES